MVYSFVKRCGGHIEVSSQLGRGTCFSLQFPVERATAKSVAPKPKAAGLQAKATSNTILVVDDDRGVREAVGRMLETDGYKVILAESSAQALDLVHLRGPEIALAILDVRIPDMSGPELGRRLTDMQLPTKLLFMSAFTQEKDSSDDERANDFLLKPFSANDLLGHVHRLLDARVDSSTPPRSS
jgi:DNA-binding NtrC family response regulator